MRRSLVAPLLLLLLFPGCSDDPVANEDPPEDLPEDPPGPPPALSRACEGSLCLALIDEDPKLMPSHVTALPDDHRIFVTRLAGTVEVYEGEERFTYLDLSSEVLSGGENGLLGIAFHPDFASNGHFFLHYTDLGADNVVERFTVDPASPTAEGASRRVILTIEQGDETAHHKAGHLFFDREGLLWISVGDGEDSSTAQDPGDLRGSLLRIDVDSGDPYGIPQDNPFVGVADAREEIVHYGLRNPWRFSIDQASDLLIIADVGTSRWEELNAVPRSELGHNFGWPIREGPDCLVDPECPSEGLTPPAAAISHDEHPVCALIGGLVYRGEAVPSLEGRYVFADACIGLRTASVDQTGAVQDLSPWLFEGRVGSPVSLGTDGYGEIYVVALGPGRVYRIEAAP